MASDLWQFPILGGTVTGWVWASLGGIGIPLFELISYTGPADSPVSPYSCVLRHGGHHATPAKTCEQLKKTGSV